MVLVYGARMRLTSAVTIVLALPVAACSTATPAQKKTWAAFDACYKKLEVYDVRLDHVSSDGRFWLHYSNEQEGRAMVACMENRPAAAPPVRK